MSVRLTVNLLVAAAVLAALSSCSAQVQGAGASGPAGQAVLVDVTPATADLVPAQEIQLAAAVTGTADTGVTWKIDEADGGTVDSTGRYAAPGAAGTFHVRAVSTADARASAVATIRVTAPRQGAVAISPKATSVVVGGTLSFTVAVTNLTSSAVTWKVQETSGCGSVNALGVYTAPGSARTCHVQVASVEDPSRSDVATVTVTAAPVITVSAGPAAVTMDACTTRTFTASVSGSSDTGVVWTADGGAITAAGVYTAPSTPGTYHVVATARASSAVKATVAVTVQEHVLAVTIDPPSVSLSAGATQPFTATVTTTCGTFTGG